VKATIARNEVKDTKKSSKVPFQVKRMALRLGYYNIKCGEGILGVLSDSSATEEKCTQNRPRQLAWSTFMPMGAEESISNEEDLNTE